MRAGAPYTDSGRWGDGMSEMTVLASAAIELVDHGLTSTVPGTLPDCDPRNSNAGDAAGRAARYALRDLMDA